MNYSSYLLEDFLTDENFIQWVKHPTAETDRFWQQWLMEHPQQRETIEQAVEIITALQFRSTVLPESVLAKMESKIQDRIDYQSPQATKTRHLPAFIRNGIAASFSALLIIAAIIAYQQYASFKTKYSTNYGERLTFQLPDNSMVILNANSSITYAQNSQTGDRELWLKGEAFFQVNRQQKSKKEMRRFIVHTATMDVVVLGTQFNVNNRRDETKVVLHTGKVKLQLTPENASQAKEVWMQPGELVSYTANKNTITHKRVNSADYVAWKDNRLIFKQTPLREIARMLEDNYNYNVVIENDNLSDKIYEGTFPADDVEVLLQTLSKSVALEIENKTLIIKEKNNLACTTLAKWSRAD